MNKILKRIISLVAASAMAVGLLAAVPTSAYAVGGKVINLQGSNWEYIFYTDGTYESNVAGDTSGSTPADGVRFYNDDADNAISVSPIGFTPINKGGQSELFTTAQIPYIILIVGTPSDNGLKVSYDAANHKITYSACSKPATAAVETKAYVPHTHNFVYTVITAPTENNDGEAADVCSCGDSKNHVVLPSIDTIMSNRLTQINQAKAGQTITLKMGMTNNLPKWFMSKLAEKNDVNFKIQIQYNHQNYEISIPRGTAIDLNEDWYGPAKLMSFYTTTKMN